MTQPTCLPGSCELLAHGTRVFISPVHRFGADALLLAHFATLRRAERACDLGTGCGIIPLRWHDRGHRGPCTALDISPEAIALLTAALQQGGITHITPLCADLRDPSLLESGTFDVVTCNPPYFTGGFVSPQTQRAAARHEGSCTTEDVCRTAARLLRDGGRFYICQRPARLGDVLCAMRSAGLEPKRLRFVTAQPGKEPWLFLAEAQKGRAPGMRVLPLLITENPDGTRPSPEMQAIYEK